MHRQALLFLPLLHALLGGASAMPTTQVATVTLTAEQAELIKRTSRSVVHALDGDNSVALWRSAVTGQTHRLVAAGNTNLSQIKTLVCQHTAAEEAKARQAKLRPADAAIRVLSAGAATELADNVPEGKEVFDAQAIAVMRDRSNDSFTELRDRLIEEAFKEAVKEPSRPQGGGDSAPAAGVSQPAP